MTKKYRIILGLTLLLTAIYFAPVASVFTSIVSEPFGWQAGISNESTIVWAAAIVLGYGYLILQNILAVFAMIFIKKSKRAAFWLLVLPGFIGILLGLLWLGLFIAFDAEFPSSLPVNFLLLAPPVTAFIIGRKIRHKK